jgi:GNAT superfamily N-acetyltransferase
MIKYLQPTTVDEKMKLMEFVYNNTNSFILNTFGYLWESRLWWCTQPIQVYMEGKEIIGLHAFSVNTKAPGTLKTYYIVTHKNHRGKGIAKKLTMAALKDYKDKCDNYFVNSEQLSDGVEFYKKLFDHQYTLTVNEFRTHDFNFEESIESLLTKWKKENSKQVRKETQTLANQR